MEATEEFFRNPGLTFTKEGNFRLQIIDGIPRPNVKNGRWISDTEVELPNCLLYHYDCADIMLFQPYMFGGIDIRRVATVSEFDGSPVWVNHVYRGQAVREYAEYGWSNQPESFIGGYRAHFRPGTNFMNIPPCVDISDNVLTVEDGAIWPYHGLILLRSVRRSYKGMNCAVMIQKSDLLRLELHNWGYREGEVFYESGESGGA
ncbi:MAG: hypothetical protein WC451_00685 [Patescibacteria group bacterium]